MRGKLIRNVGNSDRMNHKEALARLQMHPEFKVVMEAAEDMRPLLRVMTPSKDLNVQASQMLYDQGRIDGFDLLMKHLRG